MKSKKILRFIRSIALINRYIMIIKNKIALSILALILNAGCFVSISNASENINNGYVAFHDDD